MSMLGAWHRDVEITADLASLKQQVLEMAPDVIWTHMLLWPPRGAPAVESLLEAAVEWRAEGARVLLHDGDPRETCRYPQDISAAVDLALLNHTLDRSAWNVPVLHWPYAALVQAQMGTPVERFHCKLAFAGLQRESSGAAGDLYGARTACVRSLASTGLLTVFPEEGGVNNRMQVADLAPSATAVLGFGRPEVPGWIDTRVFQYPGAGGILLHDDVHPEVTGLIPDQHYIHVPRYDVEAITEAVARLRALPSRDQYALRQRAFNHIQAFHTYLNRVRRVLGLLFVDAP